MDVILERSHTLKQAVVNFVLDAEGELAQALETYAAAQSRRGSGDNTQQDLIIDSFIVEGRVDDQSPIDLFIASQPDLTESDRLLLNNWHHSFMGLFAITQIESDRLELRNWLTDKYYIVKPNNTQTLQAISRLKLEEILLTRIAPITDNYWTFLGQYTLLGKLGRPKLAVAIGNFKENYKHHLYSDAPELLEAAWQSVAQYHEDFLDFFGSDEITLPGYQLNQKIGEFQELTTEKRLAALGIDQNQSLGELAAEAGVSEAEIQAAAKETGADAKLVAQIFNNKSGNSKMVMPKVDLPAELKQAEQVTAISHPRWGQMFLPTYSKLQALLTAADWQSIDGAEKLIRHYLEDKNINAFIWQRLAQKYPKSLDKALQDYLQRPEFNLANDLDALLQEFDKPLKPDLPEIASVPLHLHELFQAAVVEVHKSKPKGKGKKKSAKGFQ
ncbi:hypothetical protein Nos7524_1298 [Nostoc sp. PCC 7524]|uniref:hypothetical protein n=1 Tax=Nostoc sp. (strain ATCC 29411 / PCC 7524) TaxID=28072 RepID=UPI00029EF55D|nr:hypothetical protein [Nostoc sp. PCC 7524]AFY47179.1 hypothetical protein Nos7524_1298 [Nostoc sp. PCC 7524]